MIKRRIFSKKFYENLFNNIRYLLANYLNLLKKKVVALLSDFWFSVLADGANPLDKAKPCLACSLLSL